jgi:hypothetical protein
MAKMPVWSKGYVVGLKIFNHNLLTLNETGFLTLTVTNLNEGGRTMIKLEAKTKLPPEEVVKRLKHFFAPPLIF